MDKYLMHERIMKCAIIPKGKIHRFSNKYTKKCFRESS